ncbi:hypothetical protein [Microbispora rosea]|nr:hypothetical protein [Microbispora rosea]
MLSLVGMTAILSGDGVRRREPIAFRWPRGRSARNVRVWVDSGRLQV